MKKTIPFALILTALAFSVIVGAWNSFDVYVWPEQVYELTTNNFSLDIINTGNDSLCTVNLSLTGFTFTRIDDLTRWGHINGSDWVSWNTSTSCISAGLPAFFTFEAEAGSASGSTNMTWTISTENLDNEVNTSYINVTILNDAVPPNVTGVYPDEWGIYMNQSFPIPFIIQANESETGLKNSTMVWDDDFGPGPVATPDGTVSMNCSGYQQYYCDALFDLNSLSLLIGRVYLNYHYRTYDNAGNLNLSSDYHLYVDYEEPNVTSISPADSTALQPQLQNFTFNISDRSFEANSQGFNSTANCSLYISGEYNGSVFANQDGTEVITVDMSGWQGTYNWQVVCLDTAGWLGVSGIRSFLIDTISPNITIHTPETGTWNTSILNITVVEANPNCIWYEIDSNGTYYTDCSAPTSVYTDLGLPDGSHNISVWANDTAGNNDSVFVSFIVDTEPPRINLDSPSSGLVTNETYMVFNFTAIDNLDSNIDCNMSATGPVVVTNATTALNDTLAETTYNFSIEGVYVWNITCWDNAGNSNTSETRNMTMNIEAPYIVPEMYCLMVEGETPNCSNNVTISPLVSSGMKDGVKINITASETVNFSIRIEYPNGTLATSGVWTDNNANSTVKPSSCYWYGRTTQCLPGENLTDGIYIINVTMVDEANAKTVDTSRTIRIDNTLPLVSFVGPTPVNDTSQQANGFTLNVSHTENNPETLTVYLNGTPDHVAAFSGNYSNIPYTGLADGIYTYYVCVNDSGGNSNCTETRTIKIDNVPPSIAISSPQNGQEYYSPVSLSTTITDGVSGVDECWYSLDSWATNTSYGCSSASISLSPGSHTLLVGVNDSAGNANTASRNFNITSPPPPPKSSGGGGWYPIAVNLTEVRCQENWSCSNWSECVNGMSIRECVDVNECGTNENRPSESIGCVVEKVENKTKTEICIPGEKTCWENSVRKCDNDGTAWSVLEECIYGCALGECDEPVQIFPSFDIVGMVTSVDPSTTAAVGGGVLVVVAVVAALLWLKRRTPQIDDPWGYY